MKRLILTFAFAASIPGCSLAYVLPAATRFTGNDTDMRAPELRQWLLGFETLAAMDACMAPAPSRGMLVNKVLRPLRIVVVTPVGPAASFQANARSIPGLSFVERDAVSPDLEPPVSSGRATGLPALLDQGDPGRSEQWYLERMRLPQA